MNCKIEIYQIIIENEYSLIASISTTTHYHVDNAILDIYDNNYHETIERIIHLAISLIYVIMICNGKVIMLKITPKAMNLSQMNDRHECKMESLYSTVWNPYAQLDESTHHVESGHDSRVRKWNFTDLEYKAQIET